MSPEPALEVVLSAIDAEGPLPFSRYMELVLYHPAVGFYASGGAGRRQDFITSPEVGPLFGAVVANALDERWDELGRPSQFTVVDAGAGPGALARAIYKAEPRCIGAIDYVAVEVSEQQRARHPALIRSADQMPSRIDTGVVLANELLDNLPFDILDYQPDRGWSEVRVGRHQGVLVEVLARLPDPRVPRNTPTSAVRVPTQDAALAWLSDTLSSLGSGSVYVFDYGVSYPVYGYPWLRTYAAHERGADPLEQPGTRDITADVDIGALTAHRAPRSIQTQAEFLVRHGINDLVAEGNAHWHEHAARPDLAAIAMRSRGVEAKALLDRAGLGGFFVLEWAMP